MSRSSSPKRSASARGRAGRATLAVLGCALASAAGVASIERSAAARPFGEERSELTPGPAVPAGPAREAHFERVHRAVDEGAERIRLEQARRVAPYDLQWGLP